VTRLARCQLPKCSGSVDQRRSFKVWRRIREKRGNRECQRSVKDGEGQAEFFGGKRIAVKGICAKQC